MAKKTETKTNEKRELKFVGYVAHAVVAVVAIGCFVAGMVVGKTN